jgi:hypothetical protein
MVEKRNAIQLINRLRLHANGPEWTGEDWNGLQISTFSAHLTDRNFRSSHQMQLKLAKIILF